MVRTVWIGFDPREATSFAIARESAKRHYAVGLPTYGVILDDLKQKGLYTRPTERRLGKLWDGVSLKYMSTEFAISRFLVPTLAKTGWALFMDCDVLVRADLNRLFELADPRYAVMCVKHDYDPGCTTKMDGQAQYGYPRKNWSSVMLINCDHPANHKLTVESVNTAKGIDLHQFYWLTDSEIGLLGVEWNWLVGHSNAGIDPKIVHFTDGGPWFSAFENVPYADEWRAEMRRWAA